VEEWDIVTKILAVLAVLAYALLAGAFVVWMLRGH
jgi:hypothetical protein